MKVLNIPFLVPMLRMGTHTGLNYAAIPLLSHGLHSHAERGNEKISLSSDSRHSHAEHGNEIRESASSPPLKKGGRGDFFKHLLFRKSPPPPLFQRGEIRCPTLYHLLLPVFRFWHLAALLLSALFCTPLLADDTTLTLSEEQFRNLGVTLGKPEAVNQAPLLNAPAQVVVPPAHEYVVSTAQAGLIAKLDAAVGDAVKKGQTLASINSSDLLTLQQQYLKAASESRLAWTVYQRDKKLRDEGVIADRRWQESSMQYNMLTTEVDEAKQLLLAAGMSDAEIKRLAATRRLNSQLQVHAPADGIVLERMVKTGERVAAQDPLYRIANFDELWLEIAIPQQRIQDIKLGDHVMLENSDVRAHIVLLGRSVDVQTQTVLGRALIDSGKNAVRAGQTVNAQIAQPSSAALFKLPNNAIALNAGQAYVFSRSADGFTVKPVQIVGKQGDHTFVTGALQGDENIAVSGAVALKANWLGLGGGEE